MFYKKASLICIAIILVFFITLSTLLYIRDPLRLFKGGIALYQGSMYFQAKNIIDNVEFNSIILGTSMLENTSAKEASNLFNSVFVNISMPGTSFNARGIVLDYVLKQKDLVNVIYSFDSGIWAITNTQYDIKYWAYLYNNFKYDDFKYYFNDKYIKCSLTFDYSSKCVGTPIDLDRPSAWFLEFKNIFGKGIVAWDKRLQNNVLKSIEDTTNNSNISYVLNDYMDLVEKNILRHVKANPNVNFLFIYTPYSTLSFWLDNHNTRKELLLRNNILKEFVYRCSEYSNCSIYAFGNENFTKDLTRYKDFTHYDEKINSLMLNKISKGENLLTKENIDEYLTRFMQNINKYDINTVIEELKQARLDLKDCIDKNCGL